MTRELAFVFPGQGSQFEGIGSELYKDPIAREIIDRAGDILGDIWPDRSLVDLCLSGAAEILGDTQYTQPAVFTCSVADYCRQVEEGNIPMMVAGHSLGELSALVAAESIKFDDALVLVVARGRLMKQAGEERPGGMVAIIGLEEGKMEALCQELMSAYPNSRVQIVSINAPGQIVISGDREAINNAGKFANQLGARRTTILQVSIASA